MTPLESRNIETRPRRGHGWLWAALIAAAVALGILLWPDDDVGPTDVDVVTLDERSPEFELGPALEPEPRTPETGALVVAEPAPAPALGDASVAPAPTTTVTAWIPVDVVSRDPDTWVGKSVEGLVTVASVPTDRGFWVTQDDRDARLFALINDGGDERPVDINEGQQIRLLNARVRDETTNLDALPGEPLDADTRRIVTKQEVFLLVHEDDLQIVKQDG